MNAFMSSHRGLSGSVFYVQLEHCEKNITVFLLMHATLNIVSSPVAQEIPGVIEEFL